MRGLFEDMYILLGNNRRKFAAPALGERYCSVGGSKEGIVPPAAHIGARVNLRSALADNDGPGFYPVSAKSLDP